MSREPRILIASSWSDLSIGSYVLAPCGHLHPNIETIYPIVPIKVYGPEALLGYSLDPKP